MKLEGVFVCPNTDLTCLICGVPGYDFAWTKIGIDPL